MTSRIVVPTPKDMDEIFNYIDSKAHGFKPLFAIQLGTGTNAVANFLDATPVPISIKYEEIPHFCKCTIPEHEGVMVLGNMAGIPVVVLKGRYHFYEGYTPQQLSIPIRACAKLGAKALILTNAAGCLENDWKLGDIMLVTDHINFFLTNPLIGQNADLFPPHSCRFPDMSNCYNEHLIELAKESGKECGFELREGIYLGYCGPSYEGEAEARMMHIMGAQAVGMSTVFENISGRHSGMLVCCMSVMTDLCLSNSHPNHQEIVAVGERATDEITKILKVLLPKMKKEVDEKKW